MVLAVANSLADCVLAGRLITGVAEHFDCRIEVVVPWLTPAAGFILGAHPSVAALHAVADVRERAEVGFVLPEYVLAGEDIPLPDCRLLYNYTDMRSVKSAQPEIRYRGYAAWLSEICGLVPDSCLAPLGWNSKVLRSETVLLAAGKTPWPGGWDLTLDPREPLRVLDLDTLGLEAAAAAIDEARAVICADEDAAIFAISRGAPVVHLSRHGGNATSWLKGRSISIPVTAGAALRGAILHALAELAPRAAPAPERLEIVGVAREETGFADQLMAAGLPDSQDSKQVTRAGRRHKASKHEGTLVELHA